MMRCTIYILGVILFTSCDVINPDEEIPSYIEIEGISPNYNGTGSEGTITSNITEAWVFLNDNNMGVWELPAKIPLLAEGNHSLKVFGGVKINGLESYRTSYPFWNYYLNDTTFNLTRGKVLKVDPVVAYYPETVFAWQENFENAGLTIDSVAGSLTSLVRTSGTDEVKEGYSAGKISLTQTNSYFKGITNEIFQLPKSSAPVYLELDYKTNVDFVVFIVAYNPGLKKETSVLGIKPALDAAGNPEWNKIYVELTFDVSSNYESAGYQVGFSTALSSEKNSGKLLLDNIKLLHY